MDNKFSKYGKVMQERKYFRKEQEKLHEKHSDIDENKVIIETGNNYKFTMRLIKNLVKTSCSIILITFASIGVISLTYSQVRAEFFKVMIEIMKEVKNMI